MLDLADLPLPVVAAPMAGGPSTPELVVAVGDAGGLGMLAAGYKTPAVVAEQVAAVRARTGAPFGVNVFVPAVVASSTSVDDATTATTATTAATAATPGPTDADRAAVDAYRDRLLADALPRGIDLPQPRWDDTDHYRDKITLLAEVSPVPVVSFTFGCPAGDDVERLHRAGTLVLVTCTDADEARAARDRGADAVVVQGFEAGGHRGTHAVAKEPNRQDHLALLPQCADAGLPMVAAGGIVSPGDTRRALAAGAVAVQAGTAYLRCPEAGTSATYLDVLDGDGELVITRAFSGRPARGVRNAFVDRHDAHVPAVFPQVDQLTKPLRAEAAARGDVDGVAAWAGAGWRAVVAEEAAAVTRRLGVC